MIPSPDDPFGRHQDPSFPGGVATIELTRALPPITGDGTSIPGGSQTENVGDTNPGQLGAGGDVGVCTSEGAKVDAPEVLLIDAAGLPAGLVVLGTDATVSGIAIVGFGDDPGSDEHGNIIIGPDANGALVSHAIVGAKAASVANPAPDGNGGDDIPVLGGDGGAVEGSLVGWAAGSGIRLEGGADGWRIEGDQISDNGFGGFASDTGDGISVEAGSGAAILGNLITNDAGAGIDLMGSAGGHPIECNTIRANGKGDTADTAEAGIRVDGAGNVIHENVTADNYGAGILVVPGSTDNDLRFNSWSGNGGIDDVAGNGASGALGIDLLAPGEDELAGEAPYVTPNDNGDADAGGNEVINFPVIEDAHIEENDDGQELCLSGFAPAGAEIDLYLAAAHASGFGEGETFLMTLVEGSADDMDATTGTYVSPVAGLDVGSETTSRFAFCGAIPEGVDVGTLLTSTAHSEGNTSEFSGIAFPDDPEDKDSFEDDDGCPDPDNDQDTVLDDDDFCPLVAGVPQEGDLNGCPQGTAVLTRDRIRIMEKVHFATNKAKIKKKSYGLLEAVAQIIVDHPQITKMRVEGHTDSKGREKKNQKLSERRAASVMKFLVEHGVTPESLVSQGYGESRPIASNKSRKGRAQNRRVELMIVEIDGKPVEHGGGEVRSFAGESSRMARRASRRARSRRPYCIEASFSAPMASLPALRAADTRGIRNVERRARTFPLVCPGVVLAATLAALGCGEGAGEGVLELRLDAGGPAPERFLVAGIPPDGPRWRASCGEEPDVPAFVTCTDAGVRVDSAPAGLELVVKARGWHFARASGDGAGGTLTVPLTALGAFEDNEDYTTGFGGANGAARFAELAHEADTDLGPSRSVKFYIEGVQTEAPEVYFQNTRKHPLHYDFARDVLGLALSYAEFGARTYSGEDREAMAGTLVAYPAASAPHEGLGVPLDAPIALTFFPSDGLTPAQAALAHRLIEERLGFAQLTGGRDRLAYLPAGSAQEEELLAAPEALDRWDALWTLRRDLFGGVEQQILNPGVAYGTLRRMSPEELAGAVVSYTDILVLTRLPNSLPIVGGTITEELQTPLAHVNVAARSRGTPNIALLDAGADARVADHLGALVRFEVTASDFSITPATLEEAQAFWDSRRPAPFAPEFDAERDGLPGFAELGFDDSVSVGAKAANLAELSHLLGANAPHGFAVPFHDYDAFMANARVRPDLCAAAADDCEEEGRSAPICANARALCDAGPLPETLWDYAARIIDDAGFRSDSELREAALDGLRYHIHHLWPTGPAGDYGTLLDARVSEVFGGDTVRLRSSTNAEDLVGFSGAGLYRSLSARAFGDEAASVRIRKVWGSVWSWRAFEERTFWGIDHLAVRMGVAVTQSFPDEAANGVLITQNIADPNVLGMYVNVQLGEVPVTNPEDGSIPEIFSIIPRPLLGVQVARQRYSSLSPDAPIMSDAEIAALFAVATEVQQHFAPLYGAHPNNFALDLEFKLHGPERALFIKQARPYAL